MKYQLPEATRLALKYLLQTATAEGVVVAGFAFSAEPPSITNFGNCPDHGDVKLFQYLCKLKDDKERAGLTVRDNVEAPA